MGGSRKFLDAVSRRPSGVAVDWGVGGGVGEELVLRRCTVIAAGAAAILSPCVALGGLGGQQIAFAASEEEPVSLAGDGATAMFPGMAPRTWQPQSPTPLPVLLLL